MRKQHTPLQLPHTDILPEIVEPLLTWYRGQSTLRCLPWREEVTPYHTWISEIMLQQTPRPSSRTTRVSSKCCLTSRASRAATTSSS